ncbi:hypothetical protein [Pseudoxanthomonas sp. Root630]|uniref:hypothetical protein n=1 Tax=Pseudoxanthomonas sp. Root630 TaxID=1736574 RepID=UPI0007025445|nr:hypothetical protein [Pseudoxanthomonas sp. Root630]KRA41847.1 hypothetical protein ASD72_14760 [Pseudoxanthomonas sp. Root630]
MHDPNDPYRDDLNDLEDDTVPASSVHDRRDPASEQDPIALRSGLSRAQLDTLDMMESFRWRLAFVRWPMHSAAIPVLFNQTGTHYVVINEDGSLDEQPGLTLRG